MQKESQIIQQLKKELTSSDENSLLKTLSKVKSKGNDQIIATLLNLFSSTEHETVKSAIKNILNELKTSTGTKHLINGLNTSDLELQEIILGALWSAGLNPKDYLPEIITASCKGNYMTAFEGLTVIENLEGPFEEQQIVESKLILNDYFSQPEDDKSVLIKSILVLINEFDENLEA